MGLSPFGEHCVLSLFLHAKSRERARTRHDAELSEKETTKRLVCCMTRPIWVSCFEDTEADLGVDT